MQTPPQPPSPSAAIPPGPVLIYYYEAQRVRTPQKIAMMVIPAFLGLVNVVAFVDNLHNPMGASFANLVGAASFAILLFGVAALPLVMELSFWVTTEAVWVHYWPFHFRPLRFGWNEIATACVREYNPVGEYRGWGLKHTSHGVAYSIDGSWGFDLTLKSGRHVLIGTRNPEGLRAALERVPRSQ